jgi:hypothetical protein
MFAFDVIGKVEEVVPEVRFKLKGNQIHLTPRLNDSQMDAALSPCASRIGVVIHTPTVTMIELV